MSVAIEILHRPAYAMAQVNLSPGESFIIEAGSMVSKSGGIDVTPEKVKRAGRGGILGAVKSMLAGEFFLVNKITSRSAGHILVAPTHVGDIMSHPLNGDLVIQSGSFLGCDDEITLDGEWQGARSFFAGESLFMMRARGRGVVLFNAFGGIETHEVDGELTVDSGHIVAFEPTLQYTVTKFGSSWIGAFLAGEGFVAKFTGKGKLYTQTRNLDTFGKLIGGMLPPRD